MLQSASKVVMGFVSRGSISCQDVTYQEIRIHNLSLTLAFSCMLIGTQVRSISKIFPFRVFKSTKLGRVPFRRTDRAIKLVVGQEHRLQLSVSIIFDALKQQRSDPRLNS